MPQPNNPMEIFKLLEKSNCRECNEKTCLAFSVSVFKGQKQLDECPLLESDIIEQFGGKIEKKTTPEQEMDESVEQLKRKIATIDLAASAQKLGARFSNDKLTIKILGKDFSLDSTAEDNLNIESIYALAVGLVRMFEKIALRHGIQ